MRQIDNMTSEEIDVLKLKGMLKSDAAPAQAQHSPLPHVKENFHPRLDVALDKMRHNIVPELSVCIIAEAYDELRAHAQRLADALAEVLTFAGHKASCRDGGYGVQKCNCGAQAVIPKSREALAEWSKQK